MTGGINGAPQERLYKWNVFFFIILVVTQEKAISRKSCVCNDIEEGRSEYFKFGNE